MRSLADVTAILLTIAAIALDGVDGYIARKRNLATPLGAQFDILGDRVVENLFFTFFAATGLISFWIPVLFFVRGTVTDFLRGLAARSGRSGFGRDSMIETLVGTKPGSFAAKSRGVRCAEVRVLLLSRSAVATAAASGYVVGCEFAAVAFGRRASFGNGDCRLLRGSRDSCDLGWAPISDERQRYCDSGGLRRSDAMNAARKIGAFFDLDGTLLAPPSLEWRFIGYLMERDEIRTVNVARWIAQSARAFLSNGHRAVLANKYYLAGIQESVVGEWEKTIAAWIASIAHRRNQSYALASGKWSQGRACHRNACTIGARHGSPSALRCGSTRNRA